MPGRIRVPGALVAVLTAVHMPPARQANPYSELNLITDVVLRERVVAVLSDPADDAGRELLPLSPIMTYETLLRLHNIVASLDQERERGGWAKQAALAKVLANVTGAGRPKDFTGRKDWEAAGNLYDKSLELWVAEHKKAWGGFRKILNKATKAGKQPLPTTYPRLTEVVERRFTCRRGCTPRVVPMAEVDSVSTPIQSV